MLVPFIIGGTSRSLASCTLMPINVVRLRLQMKEYSDEEIRQKHLEQKTNYKQPIRYHGMIDTFQKIYKYEGIPGFFKGLTPSILKLFPTSGIFFLVYELTLS